MKYRDRVRKLEQRHGKKQEIHIFYALDDGRVEHSKTKKIYVNREAVEAAFHDCHNIVMVIFDQAERGI